MFYFTAKSRLYNDLIEDAQEIEFPASLATSEMTRHVMVIVDALWYIDGNHEKINHKLEKEKKIPERLTLSCIH